MATGIASEMLIKIKELRNVSSEVSQKLEEDGMPITDIPKEQLFNYNIKSIINAVEIILRYEPSERPTMRLKKDIPDAYVNLDKVKKTKQGMARTAELERVRALIQFVEQHYSEV